MHIKTSQETFVKFNQIKPRNVIFLGHNKHLLLYSPKLDKPVICNHDINGPHAIPGLLKSLSQITPGARPASENQPFCPCLYKLLCTKISKTAVFFCRTGPVWICYRGLMKQLEEMFCILPFIGDVLYTPFYQRCSLYSLLSM